MNKIFIYRNNDNKRHSLHATNQYRFVNIHVG